MELERVQRKAVRSIYGKYARKDSPSTFMLQNRIQTLQTRRKIYRLVLLHNTLPGKIIWRYPLLYVGLLREEHDTAVTNICFRQFSLEQTLTSAVFSPRTVSEWNSLPIGVFESNYFMAALTKHFCEF